MLLAHTSVVPDTPAGVSTSAATAYTGVLGAANDGVTTAPLTVVLPRSHRGLQQQHAQRGPGSCCELNGTVLATRRS